MKPFVSFEGTIEPMPSSAPSSSSPPFTLAPPSSPPLRRRFQQFWPACPAEAAAAGVSQGVIASALGGVTQDIRC